MDVANQQYPWLELLDRPAFCVKDGTILAVNSAASNRLLKTGTCIQEIIANHPAEYESFVNGCLYLTVNIFGIPCTASITRTQEYDIFVLNQDAENDHLQALALAAQQLRIPLSNVMTVSDQLLTTLDTKDPSVQQQANQLNHSLFQLLRIIGNMSDASHYKTTASHNKQTADLSAIIDEIMEKVQAIAENQNITLQYIGLDTPVWGLVNAEKLERAIYNLLSNALKFAKSGSRVEAQLTSSRNTVSFSVMNFEDAPVNDLPFWNRYRREPSIEDTRYGLGLGMTLVSSVATAHGGTVLVDHPSPNQTRVTMTIAITTDNSLTFRSPILQIGDYAGGRDKGLLEFSDILPTESYQKIN